MALDLGDLNVNVVVRDTRSIRKMERSLMGLERGASRAGSALRALAIASAAIQGTRAITRVADSYTSYSNSVILATDSLEEYQKAEQGVAEVARKTGAELEATGLLYRRMAAQADRLGLSQQEMLDITETLNKSIALGGSSTQEAAGAMRQFTQALAGDFKASGQEINSILEQTPGLAKVIADGMEVTTAELGLMVKAQEVSADQVIAAIKKMKNSVDDDFSTMKFSISQSVSQIDTAFTVFLGRIDDLTGTSRAIHQWTDDVSEALSDPKLAEDFILELLMLKNNIKSALGPDTLLYLDTFGDKWEEVFGNLTLDEPVTNYLQNVRTGIELMMVEAESAFRRLMILHEGIQKSEEARKKGFQVGATGTIQRDADGNVVSSSSTSEQSTQDKLDALDEKRMMQIEMALEGHNQRINDVQEQSNKELQELIDKRDKLLTKPPKEFGPVSKTGALSKDMGPLGGDPEALEKEAARIEEHLKRMEDAVSAFNSRVEDTLGNSIAAALKGDFDSIEDMWKNMLTNMIAEAMAADIMNAIGAGSGNAGTAGLTQGLGGLFGGAGGFIGGLFSADGGGFTGSGSRSGGMDGKGGFLAMLHPNETVLDHTKGQGMGNVINVNVSVRGGASDNEIKKTADQTARELKRRLARV